MDELSDTQVEIEVSLNRLIYPPKQVTRISYRDIFGELHTIKLIWFFVKFKPQKAVAYGIEDQISLAALDSEELYMLLSQDYETIVRVYRTWYFSSLRRLNRTEKAIKEYYA